MLPFRLRWHGGETSVDFDRILFSLAFHALMFLSFQTNYRLAGLIRF